MAELVPLPAVTRDYGGIVASAMAEARARAGRLSQEEFGAAVGAELGSGAYTRQTVANWESGTQQPPAKVLLAAAILAHLGVDEIIGLVDGQWLETQLTRTFHAVSELARRIDSLERR